MSVSVSVSVRMTSVSFEQGTILFTLSSLGNIITDRRCNDVDRSKAGRSMMMTPPNCQEQQQRATEHGSAQGSGSGVYGR